MRLTKEAAMTLTAGEQYLLELINRARLDPAAEAERYGVDLNDGLSSGTIGTGALQVLAPSAALEAAATEHSNWMLEEDQFSHSGDGGSNAGVRIQDNGYDLIGSWGWRENLAWVGTTGSIDLAAAIEQHHEGLYRSESHRVNTFAAGMQEVGLGQASGQFTYNGTTYNSSMLTENFASSGSKVFITGVAYTDTDKDDFYSIGEGQSGVWVRADGVKETSAAAGGYGVGISEQNEVRVVVGTGNTRLAVLDMDTSDGNVKLDIVTQSDGSQSLEVSGSAKIVSGITDVTLLGAGDLDLRGSNRTDTLTGNTGENLIEGKGGEDTIYGGDGDDVVDGGYNNDLIYGGNGDDLVIGYSGYDKIYGGAGDDMMQGGVGSDKVWGDAGDDLVLGQGGSDWLYGGDGNDRMLGGDGSDRLFGGAGSDLIDGGNGNDVMTGDAGRDRFVFSGAQDEITDFTNNVDTIYLRSDVIGDDMTVADVLDAGHIVDGDAVFNFGGGHVLTVDNISDLQILANDMVII
jgi:Ca2+-binding RTX toxin-like protein